MSEQSTPKSITIGGETIEQKPLKMAVVKELLKTRQRDTETYPPIDNMGWLASQAFFGNSDHTLAIEESLSYMELEEVFQDILIFNRLKKTAVGESAAA